MLANDGAPDSDAGGNNRQNYPVITNAYVSGGFVTVTGTLASRINSTYALDFFANPAAATGPQGRTYLGSVTVVTDGGGNATFTAAFSYAGYVAADRVTATATCLSSPTVGEAGNTSEYRRELRHYRPARRHADDLGHRLRGRRRRRQRHRSRHAARRRRHGADLPRRGYQQHHQRGGPTPSSPRSRPMRSASTASRARSGPLLGGRSTRRRSTRRTCTTPGRARRRLGRADLRRGNCATAAGGRSARGRALRRPQRRAVRQRRCARSRRARRACGNSGDRRQRRGTRLRLQLQRRHQHARAATTRRRRPNPRTVQGSLRQFIQNANAIAGAATMRFVPAGAPDVVNGVFSDDGNYANDGGNDWWQHHRVDGAAGDHRRRPPSTAPRTAGSTARPSPTPTPHVLGYVGAVGLGADGIAGTGDDPAPLAGVQAPSSRSSRGPPRRSTRASTSRRTTSPSAGSRSTGSGAIRRTWDHSSPRPTSASGRTWAATSGMNFTGTLIEDNVIGIGPGSSPTRAS